MFLLTVSLSYSITDSPELTLSSSAVDVVEMQPVSLSVQVNASPFPDNIKVVTPNEQAIHPATCPNKTAGTISINFPTVNRYNTGTYVVIASNLVSYDEEVLTLNVQCECSPRLAVVYQKDYNIELNNGRPFQRSLLLYICVCMILIYDNSELHVK